jgi:hypothetical protein
MKIKWGGEIPTFFDKHFIQIHVIIMKYTKHSMDSQNFLLIFTTISMKQGVFYTSISLLD